MFTGLIEETGTVTGITPAAGGRVFTVSCMKILEDLQVDHSVAVNGVCLTAEAVNSTGFRATAVKETLQATTLGSLKRGGIVNLERASRLGDRLGGHLVQGHVDCVARIISIVKNGAETRLTCELPPQLRPYIIRKGSIAVDGISLTVADLSRNRFEIAVIPHTWHHTVLEHLKPGSRVNLEADMMAKYIENLIKNKNN